MNFECSICSHPVGEGIALRTIELYDAVLCVGCGVMKGSVDEGDETCIE